MKKVIIKTIPMQFDIRKTASGPIVLGEAADRERNMTFEKAMEAVRQGKRVKRSGWEDGAFVYYQEGSDIEPEYGRNAALRSLKGPIHILGHIDLCTSSQCVIVGWIASESEQKADDWEIADL